jgi:hypothetical protein
MDNVWFPFGVLWAQFLWALTYKCLCPGFSFSWVDTWGKLERWVASTCWSLRGKIIFQSDHSTRNMGGVQDPKHWPTCCGHSFHLSPSGGSSGPAQGFSLRFPGSSGWMWALKVHTSSIKYLSKAFVPFKNWAVCLLTMEFSGSVLDFRCKFLVKHMHFKSLLLIHPFLDGVLWRVDVLNFDKVLFVYFLRWKPSPCGNASILEFLVPKLLLNSLLYESPTCDTLSK